MHHVEEEQLKILECVSLELLLKPSGLLAIFVLDNNADTNFVCCPTLQLLIEKGNVMYFTWKFGYEPSTVESDKDFFSKLLKEELKDNIETDGDTTEIVWNETLEEEINFDIGECDSCDIDTSTQDECCDILHAASNSDSFKPTIASGETARLLLDTSEGRKYLLNDLAELLTFFQRLREDLLERQCIEDSTGSTYGLQTLQNMIFQHLPSIVQSCSKPDVDKIISDIESVQNSLNNSSLTQLMMIRTKAGYLDRLVERLLDQKRQVELAKSREASIKLDISEASNEIDLKTTELLALRSSCKNVVSILETELSKICNRPVQIDTQGLIL